MTTPDEQYQKQKEQVRSGCQTTFGCLGIVVICILVAEGLPVLMESLSRPPAGGDTIVFASFERIGNEMIYVSIFSLAASLGLAAASKTPRRALIVGTLLLSVSGAIFFRIVYWPFTAVEFRDDAIRLHYLWPRPSETIPAHLFVSAVEIRETEPSGPGLVGDVVLLELRTASRRYRSMPSGGARDVSQVKARLKVLNPAISTKDPPLF